MITYNGKTLEDLEIIYNNSCDLPSSRKGIRAVAEAITIVKNPIYVVATVVFLPHGHVKHRMVSLYSSDARMAELEAEEQILKLYPSSRIDGHISMRIL